MKPLLACYGKKHVSEQFQIMTFIQKRTKSSYIPNITWAGYFLKKGNQSVRCLLILLLWGISINAYSTLESIDHTTGETGTMQTGKQKLKAVAECYGTTHSYSTVF